MIDKIILTIILGGIGLLTSMFFIVVSVAEDWIMRLFTIPALIMCASITTLLIVEIWR
jgi:hypothetical protein